MRVILTLVIVSGMAWGQAAQTAAPANPPTAATGQAGPASVAPANAAPASAAPANPQDPNAIVIPAGSKIPLTLKQAISTKNAREGDAVYAETAFPVGSPGTELEFAL